MPAFRDMPIRQKLMLTIMVTTAVAMLLAGVGIVIFDSVLFRGYLARDLAALTQIIADNSTAALAFDDPGAAAETLGTLHARPQVVDACIYRQDGTMLAMYRNAAQPPGANCPPPAPRNDLRFGKELTISRIILLNSRPIGTLMILYDLTEIVQRERLYTGTVLCVLLAASLSAILLSGKLRSLIVKPIAQLERASSRVAETNDYSIRAQKLSGDELGRLVERFNEMLAGIQSRDANLTRALRDIEEAQERFQFMAESMPSKIFTLNPAGRTLYLNRQWMDFTGLSFDQIKDWGWIQFVHPDDVDNNVLIWQHCLLTGDQLVVQHRFRREDGIWRWHLTRAHAMRDEAGEISMWVGSSTDIHEQKEKEEELRRANDDLQQFAYSASHDLQEPIRNVAIYSELVAEQYHDRLDADGQMFLGFIKEGGRRLATLVDDLLAYTRAGVMEGEILSLDATETLIHTLASLAEAIRENNATVTWDPLPCISMGETHLQQIFQNLIANAIKYRSIAAPQIHISAASVGNDWRFSVQDNGIGIDPQYKEKIFGLFKRLHRDQKYAGTGIGLAICQRVVERYGGRIWVESAVGQGATFYFTIPRQVQRVPPSQAEAAAR